MKLDHVRRGLEVITNIILVCLAVVVAYRFSPASSHAKPQGKGTSLSRTAGPLEKGQSLTLPASLHDGQSQQTLLLVISTQCSICRGETPFYRELIQRAGASKNHLRVKLLFPESNKDAAEFADANLRGAPMATVTVETLTQRLHVLQTPTLILVDSSGRVIDVWMGASDEGTKHQILSRLQA